MPRIGFVCANYNISKKHRNQKAKTPKYLYDAKVAEHGGEFFDPCPPDPSFDGLKVDWKKRNFVNPPYDDIKPWIKKGLEEREKGNLSVFLLPVRTSTKYFHKYILGKSQIEFIKGGIKFEGYEKGAPFGCMWVTFYPDGWVTEKSEDSDSTSSGSTDASF